MIEIFKICPICNREYRLKHKKQIYCSVECQIQWQRNNPRSGNKNPRFLKEEPHEKECEWCGNIYSGNAYKIRKSRFCSLKCKREWYASDWSQREEWKENRRKWATDNMNKGKTNSSCQLKLDSILGDLDIGFKKEVPFGNFCVDNYLFDYNLIVEVMGSFWHCDSRKNKKIKYYRQYRRILLDKEKRSLILDQYGIKVLYLWEYDILERTDLCIELIKKYIDGNLKCYHSCQYVSDGASFSYDLEFNNPYMNLEIEDIDSLVDIEFKKKSSRKQPEKWIEFSCMNCGNKKEELISHYKKKDRHFCCRRCKDTYVG